MYVPTTQRYGTTAAAGVARVRIGNGPAQAYGAACVHADKRNVLMSAWSIPSFMTTAHKPEPRLLVTTS
jgi:hypothetical protein